MNTLSIYLLNILVWGSTWIVITYQLGVVAPETSVMYRFALAGALNLLISKVLGIRLRYSAKDHLHIALQGIFTFGINYIIFYYSTAYMSSGLVCISFATVVMMNIVNGRLFHSTPITRRDVYGSMIGFAGLCMIFYEELFFGSESKNVQIGLTLGIVATYFASLGHMFAIRNQKQEIPVIASNGWGMLYSAIFCTIYLGISGVPFKFDFSFEYIVSLLYLSVFGSVIAFACFFTLMKRLGAAKSSYVSILFPVVALSLSALYEGYQPHAISIVGVLFTLGGNWVIMQNVKLKVLAPDVVQPDEI